MLTIKILAVCIGAAAIAFGFAVLWVIATPVRAYNRSHRE